METNDKICWSKAEKHVQEVIKSYEWMIGRPNFDPWPVITRLTSLLHQYGEGNRSEELYTAMIGAG